jgi:hypothetical protein
MKAEKYRPCLTSAQIVHIISLCKRDLSADSISTICVLAPFQTKVENKSINAAYVMQGKQSLLNSLGYCDTGNFQNLSHQERRKLAFDKWSKNPDLCNADELELVQTYRMENDLLSQEEKDRMDADSIANFGFSAIM